MSDENGILITEEVKESAVRESLDATGPRAPLDIFSQMDKLDDEAILSELEGRLTEVAVYHFDQGGKELWGLSKVGVDWAANELAKKGYILRDETIDYQIDPTDSGFILFWSRVGKYFVAKDGTTAQVDAAIGTKRQALKMAKRDGSMVPDPFWFEKGSMKAIRNARIRLIPEQTKAGIIALAKEAGRVKSLINPNTTPPPVAFDYKRAYDGFAKIKTVIGDEEYYKIITGWKLNHINECKDPETLRQIYRDMNDFAKSMVVTPKTTETPK